ncbi:MAG: aldose epimerase family protein [Mucilaginibacter sp.]
MKYINKWGEVDGNDIFLFQLVNRNNVSINITNFGATVQAIVVPDNAGQFEDITLGYDDLQGYRNDPFYMGGIVGRFANRIAGGNIELDGNTYQIAVKEGGFHHHGGKVGFNKKVWSVVEYVGGQSVGLEYVSQDGEEGFPGNLKTTVVYTLNNDNQLVIDITAATDKTTILNLTNHAYFNLAGQDKGDIGTHRLKMPMDTYLPVNAMHVPKGPSAPVTNTPFDFRKPTAIGERIDADNDQVKQGIGYDHTWVIKTSNSPDLNLIATVREPVSGRVLNVHTTEPSVHLYTGNYLDDSVMGKNGKPYVKRGGFCLETQQYPDAPNHPHFPNVVLRQGEVFKSQTVFEFLVAGNKASEYHF